MSTLEFFEARVQWKGREIGPLSASYDGSLVLLWGDFSWLFAVLCGDIVLEGGTLRCLDTDARAAVIAGTVGVSPAGIQRAPGWTVSEWLVLNGEMSGKTARSARRAAERTLAELTLAPIASRRVADLNAAETFAAYAAFAINTAPEVAFLSTPLLLPETRDYELGIIDKVRTRCKLGVACTRRDDTLWGWAEQHAYCDGDGRTNLPVDLMANLGSRYRVRAFRGHDALIAALEGSGAAVKLVDDALIVTTPEPTASHVIVEASVAAQAPLAELVSLPEAS